MPTNHDPFERQLAYSLFRALFGLNLCMHGVARILAGQSHFEAKITAQFAHTFFPHGFLVAFALALPWVEAILGFLILAGLWTRTALVAALLLMLVLTFGICLVQNWPTAGLQLSYGIALAALLFLLPYNRYSADSLLHSTRT